MATVRPPIRQEAPVKAGERIPMSPRADTTIDEMRETDGTGSLWTVQAPPVLRDSLGNRGRHTRQRAPGRVALVQLEQGRVPAASMKHSS